MRNTERPQRRRSRSVGGGRRGWPLLGYGAAIFVVGLGITVVTYSMASKGGGTYFVSYGPMIVGLIAMVRGSVDVMRMRGAQGQQLGGSSPWPGQAAQTPMMMPGQVPGQLPGQAPMQMPVPAAAPVTQPAADWYPDPQDALTLRWWDGRAWTAQTRPRY